MPPLSGMENWEEQGYMSMESSLIHLLHCQPGLGPGGFIPPCPVQERAGGDDAFSWC